MSSMFNHGVGGRVIFVLCSGACVSMHDFNIELKMSSCSSGSPVLYTRLNGSVDESAFSSKRFSFRTSLNRGSNPDVNTYVWASWSLMVRQGCDSLRHIADHVVN